MLYVPCEDGLLHRQKLEGQELEAWRETAHTTAAPCERSGETSTLAAELALRWLLTHHNEIIPAGTQVIGVGWDQAENLATVNLSREFACPDFWQGSTKTLLGIYAIVNSAAASVANNGCSVSVQILIEDKPVEVIGEFYARDPLQPDLTLAAEE
jgi:hypothetical protein